MKTIKMPIHFQFDLDKFIACISLFAKEKLNALDKLKICKLLYFSDKYHLLKYGKPIIGDTYCHLDNGPIPSRALDIMNEIICRDKVFSKSQELSSKDKFTQFIKVKRSVFHKYPVFELQKEPNMDCLSESELEAVSETIKKYGNLSGGILIDETHKDAAWQKTKNTEEIDYRLFFDNEPGADPAALEYLESLQEDLAIGFALSNG